MAFLVGVIDAGRRKDKDTPTRCVQRLSAAGAFVGKAAVAAL